jgi:hypothetical protein
MGLQERCLVVYDIFYGWHRGCWELSLLSGVD